MNAVRKERIAMSEFKFGTCTVPDGRSGPWEISTFEITKDAAALENMRAAFGGRAYARVDAGTYRRLKHDQRGVVMSNTPMEVRTACEVYWSAKGRVLVTGLGLGMVLEGLISKPDVTFVRVVELDADVIALTAPHFAHDPRVEIVQGDAYAYKLAKGDAFDYAWHDIWDEISADNLPLMAKLARKFCRRIPAQGFWSKSEAQMHRARWR